MQTTGYSSNQSLGIEGQLADQHLVDTVSLQNIETTSVGFGRGVVDKLDGTFEELDALTKKIRGVLVHSHAYDNGDVDPPGVPTKQIGDVITRGRIIVYPEVAVTDGDEAYCRFTTGVADDTKVTKGAWRNTDDTATAAHVNRVRFRSTAAAGAPAILELLDGAGEPDLVHIHTRVATVFEDADTTVVGETVEAVLSATKTFDLGAVPAGRHVKVRSATLSVGVVVGDSTDHWIFAIKSGTTSLATFDTDTAVNGAVVQNTPKAMTVVNAAGKSLERLTLVCTKYNSGANVSPGSLSVALEVY